MDRRGRALGSGVTESAPLLNGSNVIAQTKRLDYKLCILTSAVIFVAVTALVGLILAIVAMYPTVPRITAGANSFMAALNRMDMQQACGLLDPNAVILFKNALQFLDDPMSRDDWCTQMSVFLGLLESNHMTFSGCNSTHSPMQCIATYTYKYDMINTFFNESVPTVITTFSIVFTMNRDETVYTRIEVLPDTSTTLVRHVSTKDQLRELASIGAGTPDASLSEDPVTSDPYLQGDLPVYDSPYGPVDPPAENPVVPTTEAPVDPSAESPIEPTTETPVDLPAESPIEPTTEAPVNPPVESPVETVSTTHARRSVALDRPASGVHVDSTSHKRLYGLVSEKTQNIQILEWYILQTQIDTLIEAGLVQQASIICNTTKYRDLATIFDPFGTNGTYACNSLTPETQLTLPIVCSAQGRIDATCLRNLTLETLVVTNFTATNVIISTLDPGVMVGTANGGTNNAGPYSGNKFMVTSSDGQQIQEIPGLAPGNIWMGTATNQLPAAGLPTGTDGISITPGVGTFDIKMTKAPVFNSMAVGGATTLGTSTSCAAPLAPSCLDISSQSCPSGVLSTNCIPPTGLHLVNLTVDSLTVVNSIEQIDVTLVNGSALAVDNFIAQDIYFTQSVTCDAAASISQSCYDISTKQCPLGPLDQSCVPPAVTVVNGSFTDTLAINKLVCNGGPIPASCAPLNGPAISTDNSIAVWDGVSGNLLKSSQIIVNGGIIDFTSAAFGSVKSINITGTGRVIMIADLTEASVPAVNFISYGARYYDAAAASARYPWDKNGLAIRLYESAVEHAGFGMSATTGLIQINYVTTSLLSPHVFYTKDTERFRIGSTIQFGTTVSSNLIVGTTVDTGTATPTYISAGSHWYNGASPGSLDSLKLRVYHTGASSTFAGFGVSLGQFYMAGSGSFAALSFRAGGAERLLIGTASIDTSLPIMSASGDLSLSSATSDITFNGKNLKNVNSVDMSTSTAARFLQAGGTGASGVSSATPPYGTLGNTYYQDGANLPNSLNAIKWRIYEAGTVGMGFGVSNNQFNYITTNPTNHVFYTNLVEAFRISSTFIYANLPITSAASTSLSITSATADITFNNKNLKDAYSITMPAVTGEKIILYNGVSPNIYSIGVQNGQQTYSVQSSAKHVFYTGGASKLEVRHTEVVSSVPVITTSIKAATGGGGTIDFGGATLSNAVVSSTTMSTVGTTTISSISGWTVNLGTVRWTKNDAVVVLTMDMAITCNNGGIACGSASFALPAELTPLNIHSFIVPIFSDNVYISALVTVQSTGIIIARLDQTSFTDAQLISTVRSTVTYSLRG